MMRVQRKKKKRKAESELKITSDYGIN